ncbi:MAG TPA: hypothetical protein VEB59_01565, partial [Gemmatimonadales bacterium]|nr:hypothetical protein [Gemmatimonadales bacterium]
MLPRVLPARSLAPALAWLLSACAAKSTTITAEAPTPADTAMAPVPAPPPAEALFQASAPNEIVTEAAMSRRRSAVADMFRLGTISGFQQGPVGVLRTATGDSFHTSNNRDRQYPRLALAYSTWTAPGSDLVIEIWERGEKIGEFTENAFLIGTEYATPRACGEPGPGGICGYAEGAGPPPPPAAAPAPRRTARAVPPPTAAEPNPGARGHRGFHVNLGLG